MNKLVPVLTIMIWNPAQAIPDGVDMPDGYAWGIQIGANEQRITDGEIHHTPLEAHDAAYAHLIELMHHDPALANRLGWRWNRKPEGPDLQE